MKEPISMELYTLQNEWMKQFVFFVFFWTEKRTGWNNADQLKFKTPKDGNKMLHFSMTLTTL